MMSVVSSDFSKVLSLRKFCDVFLQPCVDDDGDTITYSTVKAFSPPAGVSTDSSDVYSTINK